MVYVIFKLIFMKFIVTACFEPDIFAVMVLGQVG